MGHPLKARHVSAWVCCFLKLNRWWLTLLIKCVREAFSQIAPRRVHGEMGDIFSTCFSDTSLTYGVIQVMKAGHRYDPERFDGRASWLHAGLTIFRTYPH